VANGLATGDSDLVAPSAFTTPVVLLVGTTGTNRPVVGRPVVGRPVVLVVAGSRDGELLE
jgi:hypothetical protein